MNNIKFTVLMLLYGITGAISMVAGVLWTIILEVIIASLTQYDLDYILSFPACRILSGVVMIVMTLLFTHVNITYAAKPIGRLILKGGN